MGGVLETDEPFIVVFKLGDYALPLLFIGVLVCLFFTKIALLTISRRIFFGVGRIFCPQSHSGAMEPLKDLKSFATHGSAEISPVLGVFVGTGLTLLIQASSAEAAHEKRTKTHLCA